MSVTFTWSILPNGLRVKEVNGNPDTVLNVEFKITATDGTHTVEMLNSVELDPVAGAPFIPFAQLTEQKVIEWVKAAMPAERITRFEQMLSQRLALKANPPVMAIPKPAPWNTCSQG